MWSCIYDFADGGSFLMRSAQLSKKQSSGVLFWGAAWFLKTLLFFLCSSTQGGKDAAIPTSSQSLPSLLLQSASEIHFQRDLMLLISIYSFSLMICLAYGGSFLIRSAQPLNKQSLGGGGGDFWEPHGL